MCGASRSPARKIHTQRWASTRGMFSAHFPISAGPGRAPRPPPHTSPLMSVWEGENVRGLMLTTLTPREALLSGQALLEINYQRNHSGGGRGGEHLNP